VTVGRMLLKNRTPLFLVCLALLLGSAPKALAHAILLRSTPAMHAVVHGPSLPILLHYNSRIDARRCSLMLTNAAGKPLPVAMQTPASPAELDALAQGLMPGTYILHWQALATDGHITRGEIPFTVQ